MGSKYLLIFGGEIWSGVRENVINEVFVLEIDIMKWYKLFFVGDVLKFVGYFMEGCGEKIFVFGGGFFSKYCNIFWEVKI